MRFVLFKRGLSTAFLFLAPPSTQRVVSLGSYTPPCPTPMLPCPRLQATGETAWVVPSLDDGAADDDGIGSAEQHHFNASVAFTETFERLMETPEPMPAVSSSTSETVTPRRRRASSAAALMGARRRRLAKSHSGIKSRFTSRRDSSGSGEVAAAAPGGRRRSSLSPRVLAAAARGAASPRRRSTLRGSET